MHPASDLTTNPATLNRDRYESHTLRIARRATERQRELDAKKAGAKRTLPVGP
jgi:hypothetical protein